MVTVPFPAPLHRTLVPLITTAAITSLYKVTVAVGLQVPLFIDHCKTALVPLGTPVTCEVLELRLTIVAVPLITDQVPVPTEGATAAMVKIPLPHWCWSGPALVVGEISFFKVTDEEDEHEPLVRVHCRTVGLPAVTPVTVEL